MIDTGYRVPLGTKLFTTGIVARVAQVAPRTVAKWIDSGLLKGYPLPGSRDRRVTRESLIRFLREHGMREALARLGEPTDTEGGA